MAFQVHHPESVERAIGLAGELAPDASFLAGGTDLIIQINRKRRAPRHLIALGGIGGLAGIEWRDGECVLGALTTHKTIERCADFQGQLAALAEAARVVGGHQVRNIATIGGNIVNASPAADLLPPLLALDAAVELAGPQGTRRVPIAQFLRGPGSTDRADNEILLRIAFPGLSDSGATTFLKAGRRRAMEISVVSVAAVLDLDANRRCRTARIALGAVGPVAMRAPAAERALQGREPAEAAFAEAGRLAAEACAPISDVRASAEYRRMLIQALVPRALRHCLQRIEARS
jgi:carbon-monoxide dehydrogenase medium subunit